MGFNYFSAIFLLVIATVVAAGLAETVVVGGSEGWRYGYNYTDWALKHGPFYINDTLVFKYGPPSKESRPHSVYLLPNLYSYATCDFSNARLLSNLNEADGNAFSYVLNQWRPQYLASGEGDGSDCKEGLMKFFAVPLPRWFN
ncbi:uncharacterized protein LOC105166225 [Sesamum indicum]|uniref:Uncharacterized protein LOC105166225 n=1 Tax=Sesamum indicum TaxID=4182 RepID=A0A6I9TRF3_SESIN|nr:uncharacterized protein LOC105166225 [Sesamum indicum]